MAQPPARRLLAGLTAWIALIGLAVFGTGDRANAATEQFTILVFSKTAAYRHDSIPSGIAAFRELGQQHGFGVDATEDAGAFTDQNLGKYAAVVFLVTTGDVLNDAQQEAFERYIRGGGGYVGVHAASDTEYSWPFYGQLVGAYFSSHPHIQQADIHVEDSQHPATAHLPATWTRTDEWYNYKEPSAEATGGFGAGNYSPRANVHVLASLDENSYVELDGSDLTADDHPIAWCQNFAGGRSFYTGGGHTAESYAEPAFRQHLLGGVRTAAGVAGADCSPPKSTQPPSEDRFEQVTLAMGVQSVGEPIAMAVLPDGRVLHTARDGRVFLSGEGAGTTLAARIPVYMHDEEGLQGIELAPDFAQSRWVYVMYAPKLNTPADDPSTPGLNEGDAPQVGTEADFDRFEGETYVSRFKLNGDELDLGSEQVVLRIPADRGICCHVGGDLHFDAAGNLYVSTGDDTNPFFSEGYSPIDERPTRNPSFDAQRTSANTNDLRGKILRVHPEADGSYRVPAGNLFGPNGKYPDADPAKVRPEIYAMGFRNPFRFSVDRATGWLYVGEYGPDAPTALPGRGPGGLVEVMQIREPGNFGWPYCLGPNLAYNDYDFETGQSGPPFDCDAPVNESPRNTGLRELPPAQHPWIWYDGGTVHYNGKSTDEFGNGGEAPMGGPVYRYDPTLDSPNKFPEYFDGHFFMADWTRGWIKEITIGEAGEPAKITPFFDSATLAAPMDFEFGPDGSLYVMDYGSGGYFQGSADSAVYKVNYVEGSRAPIAQASADPTSGSAPLKVAFSSAGTRDPDGDALTYSWDFDGDGVQDSAEPNPTHVYRERGVFTATLTVSDSSGKAGASAVTITVGNNRPTVTLKLPTDGGVFDYGERLPFEVVVTDPEDGTINCDRVRVETALGHNEHAHGDQSFTGCSGTVTVPAEWEPDTQSSFYVVSATYTDDGGASEVPPLTGSDVAVLQPRVKQAEHFSTQRGVVVQGATDSAGGGGRAIGGLADGDYVSYRPMHLGGIDAIDLRVASGGLGGTVEARVDVPDGPVIGATQVPNTGGDQSWRTVRMSVQDPGGTHQLFLVFRNPLVPSTEVITTSMLSLNYLTFIGRGVNAAPKATATAWPQQGSAPLAVAFDGSGTDQEGDTLSYRWDFGVDGASDDIAQTATATYTYRTPGTYTATLTVKDDAGATDTATVKIVVDDATKPTITDLTPADGAVITDRRPTIGATVRDETSDITGGDITMYLDGQAVTGFSYDPATNRLSYTPGKRLAAGTHEVRVYATDAAGNVGTARWSFTV